MEDISQCVQAIRVQHRQPTVVSGQLLFYGAEQWVPLELVGVPSPGMLGRTVTFERAREGKQADLERWRHGDKGALVEAVVKSGSPRRQVRFTWFGQRGEVRLVMARCEVELEEGEPVTTDEASEVSRRRGIRQRVRKWLAGWSSIYDGQPRQSLEECLEMDVDETNSIPLREALGPFEYAPVCHLPAESIEVVTLGELAKLARLQVDVHGCEHTRLPHLYVWLTNMIQRERLPLDRPHRASGGSYLTGDECPECAISDAREFEGVRL